MSDAPRSTNPQSQIPQITALSIAFPLNIETPNPEPPKSPAHPSPSADQTPRPPRRHDAGK